MDQLFAALESAWQTFQTAPQGARMLTGFLLGTAGLAVIEAVTDAIIKRTPSKKDDAVWSKVKPYIGAVRWVARTIQTGKVGGYK